MTQTSPTAAASATATPTLDATLTLALALASEAAYDDFDGKPLRLPQGWELAGRWTGWDPVFRGGSEEKYGLLLRATDGSGAYIVAFRGTASLDDVLDDGDVPKRAFTPSAGTLSTSVQVEAGFYGIYNDTGAGMTQSMRQQLQQLLAKDSPSSVYVTGHSLGGALAHLFAFDLSFGPYAAAFTRLTTFASPRVGDDGWRDTYDARIPSANSIRVYNQQDLVPKVPPKDFGYHDVGSGFPVWFERRTLPDLYPLSRHALLNYIIVLQNAFDAPSQTWAGSFPDATDAKKTMVSQVPNPPTG
ncbi:MAG: lipase family protein [Xanthomonadaceae bacterium]|nr:lipase family protein [Xanthomonadaceae bacterium]